VPDRFRAEFVTGCVCVSLLFSAEIGHGEKVCAHPLCCHSFKGQETNWWWLTHTHTHTHTHTTREDKSELDVCVTLYFWSAHWTGLKVTFSFSRSLFSVFYIRLLSALLIFASSPAVYKRTHRLKRLMALRGGVESDKMDVSETSQMPTAERFPFAAYEARHAFTTVMSAVKPCPIFLCGLCQCSQSII